MPVGNDCCHCDSTCGLCELLYEILSLKYVPLVVLHRAMDVRKLGLSAVRTYVRLAIEVQNIQKSVSGIYEAGEISSSKLTAIVGDEAMLLAFAWEKLNTGHFSEVDDNWRLFYAALSLLKSVRLAVAGQYLEAIAAADLGLLMGDCVPDLILQRYAQFCDSCLPPPGHLSVNEVIVTMPSCLTNSVPIPVFTDLDNFEYLHRILSRRVVPVEQGSKYTDSNWSQKLMTGSEFFKRCTFVEDERPLYLAQHRLFDQIPQLSEDFSLPLYCDHCEDVERNCWIGPGGTISPLHTDPRENLFCQIMGRKFFRLVSPAHSEYVYAFEDGIITNTSQVDALNPNLGEYPNFAKVQCWDGVVESGDVLFIPKGWWHLVSSLSNSISISFWFDA
ncbi:hypothetical protein DICVIV_02473 [Dictyocaulus viviparus]|uniref:JmjC domain-containing protein n=1 Tax=Dictyocaulus viviparus TaxID=29172 RepID=A0A0D8Y5U5_DICVI|nr:hypothetical protein DICVIV_02473 [Dictyocaulus viviparus]